MSQFLEMLRKIRSEKILPIPPGVEKFWNPAYSLRPYQVQMVWNMIMSPRFLCGDAVGLGKTAMGAATMCAIKSANPTVKFIVFTTTSAQMQWVDELDKFTTLKSRALEEEGRGGPQKVRRADFKTFLEFPEDDVLVMRYSTLVADGEQMVEAIQLLAKDKKVCVVFDEATAFKSGKTLTYKRVRALSEVASWVYGLTATAVKNHLMEAFWVFKGLGLDIFGGITYFRQCYCVFNNQKRRNGELLKVNGHTVKQLEGYKNLGHFMLMIEAFFWNRTQSEVGEQLPELNTETVTIPLSAEQERVMQDVWAGLVEMPSLDEETGETTSVVSITSKLSVLMYHQMITLNSSLISKDPAVHATAPMSPKEQALVDLLNYDLQDQKCIVYTRFRREIERLKVILPRETGRNLCFVHGDMDKQARRDNIKRFQEDPAYDLIIINSAAFEAVNLQQAANLICMDLPWSWGDMLQLVGRMVRLRSPHTICTLHILECEDSIDSYVIKTLKNKKGIFERILTPKASLGVFDTEDVEVASDGSFINELFDSYVLKKHSYNASKPMRKAITSFS